MLRQITLAAAALALTLPHSFVRAEDKDKAEQVDRLCKSLTRLAGEIMHKRQGGVTYYELLNRLNSPDNPARKLHVEILDDARTFPVYFAAPARRAVTKHFKQRWNAKCYDRFGNSAE